MNGTLTPHSRLKLFPDIFAKLAITPNSLDIEAICSPGTAVPTGTTFVAVVADVSNMTSLLFHCTAIGLRGL